MRQNTTNLSHSDAATDSSNAPLGMPALIEELSAQGLSGENVLMEAGLWGGSLDLSLTGLSVERRLKLFRTIARLSKEPDTALRAGRRQQVGYFGVFGFAMATSRTIGDAIKFGLKHVDLAGSVVPIQFEIRDEIGIFRSVNPRALGDVLPFAAEYWRSSISTLLSHILGEPFPSLAMYFPYPPPHHNQAYRKTFDCHVYFNSEFMEWHFDQAVLSRSCVNADEITAGICQKFCERILSGTDGQTGLQRQVKNLCLGRPATNILAGDIAQALGMSLRTLQRRLSEEGVTYQALVDDTRRSIALEYLRNTSLSISEISFRCGFSDVSNFRKAFKKWTGTSATSVRTDVQ